jgi:hypothetical protein
MGAVLLRAGTAPVRPLPVPVQIESLELQQPYSSPTAALQQHLRQSAPALIFLSGYTAQDLVILLNLNYQD